MNELRETVEPKNTPPTPPAPAAGEARAELVLLPEVEHFIAFIEGSQRGVTA